jgi:prefoldin alpha subunit
LEEKQRQLQQLGSEIELLQNQVGAHNQNLELLTMSLAEMRQTLDALEQLKKTETEREILMPLGTGVFIRSTLKQNDRVIIGVGSSVSIEKNVDEAKAIVDKRIEETDSALKGTQERVQEISGRLEELNASWQQMYRELSEAQPPPR